MGEAGPVSSQVSLSSRIATADGADNLELGTPTREARRGPAGEVGSPPNPAGVPLKSDRRWWPGPRTEAARLKIKTSQKIAGQAGRGRGGPVRPALSPIQSFSALVHGRPLRGLPGEPLSISPCLAPVIPPTVRARFREIMREVWNPRRASRSMQSRSGTDLSAEGMVDKISAGKTLPGKWGAMGCRLDDEGGTGPRQR